VDCSAIKQSERSKVTPDKPEDFNPKLITFLINRKPFGRPSFLLLYCTAPAQIRRIMKKAFLSMALLGLFAVGTVNAQEQDKKDRKKDKQKNEQPADMKKTDGKEDPNTNQQKLSNEEQKQKDDQQKQYDPNQQPAQQQQPQQTEPKKDTAMPQ